MMLIATQYMHMHDGTLWKSSLPVNELNVFHMFKCSSCGGNRDLITPGYAPAGAMITR